MKLLLLGATGRTGCHVLDHALARGHQVHALLRNHQRLTAHQNLTAIEGNPSQADQLAEAMTGCEAVINVLNISRTSDFPWARLRTPETFLSDTMRTLLTNAEDAGVRRVVSCSAWGAAETRVDIPGWFRWFIDHSNIGVAYADHERAEQLLQASSLGYTIVRPVGLTNSKREQSIRESCNNTPKPSLTISRRTVAQFLVDALANDALIGQAVTVSKD